MFANEHEYQTPFSGDPETALQVASTALIAQGFEITEKSADELRATGPGLSSTKQPALCGASEIVLRARKPTIVVQAQLGGVQSMKRFVWFFPPLLALSLMAIFAVVGMPFSWTPLLAVAPWFIIAPVFSTMLERRARNALDSLARSMAQTAK